MNEFGGSLTEKPVETADVLDYVDGKIGTIRSEIARAQNQPYAPRNLSKGTVPDMQTELTRLQTLKSAVERGVLEGVRTELEVDLTDSSGSLMRHVANITETRKTDEEHRLSPRFTAKPLGYNYNLSTIEALALELNHHTRLLGFVHTQIVDKPASNPNP